MNARDFDPVFSAALRNELEARADRASAQQARPFARLRRPQVWITAATALVLLLATVGVLRAVAPTAQPAGPGSAVVDPLVSVTTPDADAYVARAVNVLLHVRGTGSGVHDFTVPPGVSAMTVFVACSPSHRYSTGLDGGGFSSGTCDRETGGSFGVDIRPGEHSLRIRLPRSAAYALLAIETPGPTVADGAVIDPLTAVRDRRTPDALVGDTGPLLQASGTRTGSVRTATVPDGVQRLRVFLVCQPSSAATRVRIDGHQVLGCMNSVAHWFDFTPRSRTVSAQVVSVSPTDWRLLVVPAPDRAQDSPANALLPYPAEDGREPVLVRARGVGGTATGQYVRRTSGVVLDITCRGTGWLEVQTGDGSSSGRGDACEQEGRMSAGFGGQDDLAGKRLTWTAIPHGDISWTLTILDGG